jgi:hypothetical protein
MLDPKAHARRTDPSTSHEAAHRLQDVDAIESVIYAELIRLPGQTHGEVWEHLVPSRPGLERQAVHKRLSDLKNAGLAYPQGERVWPGSNRKQEVWWPIVSGPEQRKLL